MRLTLNILSLFVVSACNLGGKSASTSSPGTSSQCLATELVQEAPAALVVTTRDECRNLSNYTCTYMRYHPELKDLKTVERECLGESSQCYDVAKEYFDTSGSLKSGFSTPADFEMGGQFNFEQYECSLARASNTERGALTGSAVNLEKAVQLAIERCMDNAR